MPSSLQYAGLELLGDTYQVVSGGMDFGDSLAVTRTIQSQLTMGSGVFGDFSDNRTITLQVFMFAADRATLAANESALRSALNSSTPQSLVWTPDGGHAVVFDTFRGQAKTEWSGMWENVPARLVTITMQALPFGRSDTQRTISGTEASVQIGNFAQSTEYTYEVPTGTATESGGDITTVPLTTGTAYGPQTTPTPIDGNGCMRMDLTGYFNSGGFYSALGKIGPISVTLDLSACIKVTVGVDVPSVPTTALLILEDGASASQTFTTSTDLNHTGWVYLDFDLSNATIDLSTVTSWTLWIDHHTNMSTRAQAAVTVYAGMLRAYPASSSAASTTNGAVYKFASVKGDAQAPASVAFDRGGTNTISGLLVYRAPSGTPATTPSLVGITSGSGTTTAPSTFNGTYRVIAVNSANIAAGATMTVTQKLGSTTVATTTLTAAAVAGGTHWGDFGDVTLPLVDVPGEADNLTYTFAVTGTDVILCDTRGTLVWVPKLTAAKYVWADEATASGAGGVYAGNVSDRTDATSLLGLTGVQIAGSPSLDPGDNYLLVYCVDGAPTNVSVDYYDRYLGERTTA